MNLLYWNISVSYILGKKVKKKKKYNNFGCIVWNLIIGITLLINKDYVEKSELNIYI